jgi:hypothetical protein
MRRFYTSPNENANQIFSCIQQVMRRRVIFGVLVGQTMTSGILLLPKLADGFRSVVQSLTIRQQFD